MKSTSERSSSTKSFAEASVQTILGDPENFLRDFEALKLSSDCEIQTDACVLEPKLLPCGNESEVGAPTETHEFDAIMASGMQLPFQDYDDQSDESSSFDQEQELQRRLCPTRPEDFEMLQSELVHWRRREERKIAVTARSVEHKKAMTKVLLDKESCILRKINSLKNAASEKCKTSRAESKMEKSAQPKIWEVGKRSFIGVETPETSRAREMKKLYDDLGKRVDNVRARTELLQRIRDMLDIIEQCGLARDVSALVDRELEILKRAELENEMLQGLRCRTRNQFAKLINQLNSGTQCKTNDIPKFRIRRP